MKRKIALLMALVFAFISTVPVAFAEDVATNIIEAEAPVITDNGGNKDISVAVSCSALANGATSAPVYLFAVRKDKVNGKIDSVAVDSCTLGVGGSDTLTASLPNGGDDYDYAVYVWESFENQRTVINQPPTEPGDVEVNETTLTTADISWSEASDDRNAVSSYNIYRDGLLVGSTDDTSYTIEGLDFDDTVTCDVTAVDASGLESEYKSSAKATTTAPPTITYISANPNKEPNGVQTNNLDIEVAWGGQNTYLWTAPAVVDGLKCHTTTRYLRMNSNGTVTFVDSMFNVLSPYEYLQEDDNHVMIEFTYFDKKPSSSTETITMYYAKGVNASGAAVQGSKTTQFKGTGYWRTFTLELTDASYSQTNRVDAGKAYNLRIKSTTAEALKIHKLTVAKAEDYVRPAASVKMKDGALILRDILVYRDDALVEYDTAGDEACLLIADGNALEMDVEKIEAGQNNVNVEVTYYDEGDGEITLEYAGGTEPKVISRTDSGEWKTALIELDDAAFNGSISGATGRKLDLKLSGDGDLHVKAVRVY